MKNVVIKKQNIVWIGKNCKCLKCGSTWEMEESDAPKVEKVVSTDQRDGTYYTVPCPGCGDAYFLG